MPKFGFLNTGFLNMDLRSVAGFLGFGTTILLELLFCRDLFRPHTPLHPLTDCTLKIKLSQPLTVHGHQEFTTIENSSPSPLIIHSHRVLTAIKNSKPSRIHIRRGIHSYLGFRMPSRNLHLSKTIAFTIHNRRGFTTL